MNLYEELSWRGFVAQCTAETELMALLGQERVVGYIGFDPTATSLHVGHLLPIIGLMHMQRAGHRPVALVGGGTGMIGDPSFRTETRNLLTLEQIKENADAIKSQLMRFLDFGRDQALMVNNADWLAPLKYIEFLRDIGRYFSVNKMMAQDSVKSRLEVGLSFIEFNYSLLQAYDFMVLARDYGCRLQMGGNDQWGNIVAGVDLSRRMLNLTVYGLTFPLLTTSSGVKMGKTAAGAVWLDPERTSVYDFYQYWINTTDEDVKRFLPLFTFLPKNQVDELNRLEGSYLRQAKQTMAFEVTRIVHGESQARQAQAAAQAAFGQSGDLSAVPTLEIARIRLEQGIPAFQLLLESGLCASSSEARRLVAQGGAYVGEERLTSFDQLISLKQVDGEEGAFSLWAGKKKFRRIVPV